MKSPIAFLRVLFADCGERCHVSTDRDIKTVSARFEHEGWSFLTITLSNFGQELQKALELGCVADDAFPGFSRSAGLPRFLGGFLQLVFDPVSGVLLDAPSSDAIRSIRQLTLAFGKIEIPCSPERVSRAFDAYVKCEQELRKSDIAMRSLLGDFSRVGRTLFARTFAAVDLEVYKGEVLPKHGPGATADRLAGNAKWDLREWTTRLEGVFPFVDYGLPSHRYWETSSAVQFLEPGSERPVKVTAVPKTLKTPRLIAIEPACMQFMQQAILGSLTRNAQKDDNLWSLLGWLDQVPNQDLARQYSRTGGGSTLDLSEASDRVSNQLVRALVEYHPWLSQAVDATRSRKADVPGLGVQRLAKFASMGSALCFPFEAMVFTTIVCLAWEQVHNTRFTREALRSLRGKVRVFGDDIIVPEDLTTRVISLIEAFGLKVNVHKSFRSSKFRESCGSDWWDGVNVGISRVRQPFPESLKDAQGVVSTVSLRNQLFELGCHRAVDYLDGVLGRLLPAYPVVTRHSPVLGRWTHDVDFTIDSWDSNLHIPLVRGCVVSDRLPVSRVSGIGALMKWFHYNGDEPLQFDHLQRAGRPVSVDIKTRKIPVYQHGKR